MSDKEIFTDSVHNYLKIIDEHVESYANPAHLFRGQRKGWTLLPRLARLYEKQNLKAENGFEATEKKMLEDFKQRVAPYIRAHR